MGLRRHSRFLIALVLPSLLGPVGLDAYRPEPTHLQGLTKINMLVFVWHETPDAGELERLITENQTLALESRAGLEVATDYRRFDPDCPTLDISVSANPVNCADSDQMMLVEIEVKMLERVTLVRNPLLPISGGGLAPTWLEETLGVVTRAEAKDKILQEVNRLVGYFCESVAEMNARKGRQTQP